MRNFYSGWLSPQRWMDRIGISTSVQLVMGLIFLMLSTLLLAQTLNLFPDANEPSLRERAVISEMAAIETASRIGSSDNSILQEFLKAIMRRYKDVLSAAIRSDDGVILVQTANHESNWISSRSDVNTSTFIRVPLYKNQKPWGRLEVCFAPLAESTSWYSWWYSPAVRLTIFISVVLFLLYWFYLFRMLKILDPTSAVPDRMQLFIDTMVEGVVILDAHENIVMVNQAFATIAFLTVERLVGKRMSSLQWLANDRDETPDDFPWKIREALQQRGILLRLGIGTRHARRLTVNVSPVIGTDGSCHGTLVTCNDQTVIEAENLRLTELITKASISGDWQASPKQAHRRLSGQTIIERDLTS